jgi:hypothetical protein
MLYFSVGRVLVFHLKKEHEEGYRLTHHLRTENKTHFITHQISKFENRKRRTTVLFVDVWFML